MWAGWQRMSNNDFYWRCTSLFPPALEVTEEENMKGPRRPDVSCYEQSCKNIQNQLWCIFLAISPHSVWTFSLHVAVSIFFFFNTLASAHSYQLPPPDHSQSNIISVKNLGNIQTACLILAPQLWYLQQNPSSNSDRAFNDGSEGSGEKELMGFVWFWKLICDGHSPIISI